MVAHRPLPFRTLICLGLLGLAACAKTGEPQPPQAIIPRPAINLVVRQVDGRILLTVSPPTVNTNGSNITTQGRVEVFRLTSSIRSDGGPIQEKEFLASARPVDSISPADFARYLREGVLAIPDDDASAASADLYARGFRYAVRFLNRRNQSAGFSNQAFIAPVPIPAAPGGLACEYFADRVLVTWKQPGTNVDGSAPARIAGYNIYRSADPAQFPQVPINPGLMAQPGFEDRDFEFGRTYYYAVSVVGSREHPYAESPLSTPLKVAPTDIFPPGTPRDLTAVQENGVVTLLWAPPADADLAGFRVLRAEEGGSGRTLLQEPLITTLSYRDDQARLGKKYTYYVVAVDAHGNESPAATLIVEVR